MKKEDFFEVLGELDDNIVKEAETPVKKKNNWKVWGSMAACLAAAAVLGAGILHNDPSVDEKPTISTKPVINFEGVVAAVDDNNITLKDGKTVIITENTEFMGDPDIGHAVSEDILVGNFIQGYTEDPADAAEITAGKIWTNEGRTAGSGKRAVNFEGRVIKVEQDCVTLDNGKIVKLAEDTAVTSPEGSSAKITVGDYIQGYAENAESSEITAAYILITTL
ncbi:MAG: hypothetical protein IJ042_03065 [Butyricicoccus sp.]|nr:hypothetical protein [Butyricicoccus sp.]